MKTAKIDLYEAKDGWRWRMLAKNGRIVAESGEAYVRKAGALKAIQRMREIAVVAAGPDTVGYDLPSAAALAKAKELH